VYCNLDFFNDICRC